MAEGLGLEVILGTFIAGAIISLLDRDEVMTHPDFRRKLEAIGFGFFIPVFFVASGVRFDLDALVVETSNLVMVADLGRGGSGHRAHGPPLGRAHQPGGDAGLPSRATRAAEFQSASKP